MISSDPLVLDIRSRRIKDGDRIVLLHVGDDACVEAPGITVKHLKGTFQFSGLSIGPVSRDSVPEQDPQTWWRWSPHTVPQLTSGDRVVVAAFSWFSKNTKNTVLPMDRPAVDSNWAPKSDCLPGSYRADPDSHQYCCRPHEEAEAAWSDKLAARRGRGELNPEIWPPVRDGDAFEVAPAGTPTGDPSAEPAQQPPADVTIDDLD